MLKKFYIDDGQIEVVLDTDDGSLWDASVYCKPVDFWFECLELVRGNEFFKEEIRRVYEKYDLDRSLDNVRCFDDEAEAV